MKTTTQPMFSNGSEFMNWHFHNCDKCVKAVFYNEKTDLYPKYRCSVQRDIDMQVAGLDEVSIRSYNATRDNICSYLHTERKQPRKRKVKKNQQEFEFEV